VGYEASAMRGTLAAVTVLAALVAAAPARASLDEARAWAAERAGHVAFAVVRPGGQPAGLHARDAFPSASVVKAMLLVAALRDARHRDLTRAERARLGPMIHTSDNAAARWVHARVGDTGLYAVGRAAHMRDLRLVPGVLFDTQITAADQARFVWRIDTLVPARHRAYARALLGHIVWWQSWGIPAALRPLGYTVFFKGGWRPGLFNQVALVERGGRRVAGLAILTSGSPTRAYAKATLVGIARRVMRSGWPSSGTSGPAGR
jgi:hypothetical protein